ncbi:MAG: sensor histidine kinase [Pseudomonadota bacterium]
MALTATASLLVERFEAHLAREADTELEDQLVELVALTRVERDGTVRLAGRLPGARFARPFSGWGWQIRDGDAVVLQSPSLGPLIDGGAPALTAPAGSAGLFRDSEGRALRGLSRNVAPRFYRGRLTFAVARPQDEIDAAVGAFAESVALALGSLGVGLVCTTVAALWFGLRPLRSLKGQIARMREGQGPEERDWPEEIAPVAEELSALHVHTERLVSRARGLAADLAHAIKTPLSVVRAQAETLPEAERSVLERQAERIGRSLEAHLGRSGAGGPPRGRVPIEPCVEELVMACRQAWPEQALVVVTKVAPGAAARLPENDLYDILGNPLENAFKWAVGQIQVVATASDGRVEITIEDDGPGIPETEREAILERGRRLDERTPGHGLGLAIASDLITLHDGSLALGTARLGGLSVRIVLPGTSGSSA